MKTFVIKWKTIKKKQLNADLISIEQQLFDLFEKCPSQIFEQEDLELLKDLTQRKNAILSIEEATQRLRSRAIWIEKGDKNTIFFHKYASQRCSHNSIWDLPDEDENLISTDTELKVMSYKHFKEQYIAFDTENIDLQLEVLKIVPRFFNEEIDKLVSITELQETISKMPKEKSHSLDGWTKELFHTFFDIMGVDLLNTVEESRCIGYILGALNAYFYALIPKISKPVNFNDFRPIALCNFSYKVI